MSAKLNEIVEIIINKIKNKEFNFAIKKTNDLLKENPNNDFLWNLKGYIFQSKNNLIEALDCFKSALRINSKNIEAKNNLGLIYQNVNKLSLASNCFNECIKINPNYVNSIFNLAKLKLDGSDYKKSKELNDRLMKLCKNLCDESKKLKIEIENLSKK